MTTETLPASRPSAGVQPYPCPECCGVCYVIGHAPGFDRNGRMVAEHVQEECGLCAGYGAVHPDLALLVLEVAYFHAQQARLDPRPLPSPERLRRDQEADQAEEAFADALAASGAAWERDGPKGRVRWELDRMGRPRLIGQTGRPGLPSASGAPRLAPDPTADPCAVAFEEFLKASAFFFKARRLGSGHPSWDQARAKQAEARARFAAALRAKPNGTWNGWQLSSYGEPNGPDGWSYAKEMAKRAKAPGHEGGNGDGHETS